MQHVVYTALQGVEHIWIANQIPRIPCQQVIYIQSTQHTSKLSAADTNSFTTERTAYKAADNAILLNPAYRTLTCDGADGEEYGIILASFPFHLSPFTFHLSPWLCTSTVALRQCLPMSSVCCFPVPGGPLRPCYVVLPSSTWSSP